MSGIVGDMLRLAGWAVLAFGALALSYLPGEDSGWLCGVWGCYPPLQALVAMHAFWAVVVAAGTDWLVRHVPSPPLGALGKIGSFVGLALLVATVLRGTVPWLHFAGWPWHYLGQRVVYVVATTTDAPVVQVLVGGLVCWRVARRRERRPTDVPAAPVEVAL